MTKNECKKRIALILIHKLETDAISAMPTALTVDEVGAPLPTLDQARMQRAALDYAVELRRRHAL